MGVNVLYEAFNRHVKRSSNIYVIFKDLIFEFVTKAEICDFPHIVPSKNILRLEISMKNLWVDQINVGLKNLRNDVNYWSLVKFFVVFKIIAERSMLTIFQN